MTGERRYIYGPIASRRLGSSLGVDPIPFKTCNENCVYCQLGRTVPVSNARDIDVDASAVLAELKEALDAAPSGSIDWVTFVGSGETTLHPELAAMVHGAKGLTNLPVAVITNGSLFYLPSVREALLPADAVLTKFDAGSPELFRKLNRPHPDITFERVVEGLRAFRAEYRGKLWVEVMLIAGVNDTEEALSDIARLLASIRPDRIHLSAPVRPPAEPWVKLPDDEARARAVRILGAAAEVLDDRPATATPALVADREAIAAVVQRHPQTRADVRASVPQLSDEAFDEAIASLMASGQLSEVERGGVRYLAPRLARFPASPDAG